MNGALNLHPKVAAAGLSGTLAIVIVYVLSLYHIDVPTVVSAAIATTLAGIGGWLAPNGYPSTTAAASAPAETTSAA